MSLSSNSSTAGTRTARLIAASDVIKKTAGGQDAAKRQLQADPTAIVELRRWAYEQTSDHSTTDRRIKAATEIVAWVLGEGYEQDQPNES